MGDLGPGTTAFEVRGLRNGSIVSVIWDRGSLDGDPPTLDLIELERELADVARNDPNAVGFASPVFDDRPDVLADPRTAFSLIEHVIDRVTEVIVISERSADEQINPGTDPG